MVLAQQKYPHDGFAQREKKTPSKTIVVINDVQFGTEYKRLDAPKATIKPA